MKILISAAETSSDAHGAELLKALREREPGLDAFGIGGPRLRSAGLRVLVDARELLAMGFGEILLRLPRIFRALREITRAVANERPDVAVVIDYPDFHFRLARKIRALGVPVVYYIPPKVWAWRKGRTRLLRAYFAKVLSILPFEVPFYEREGVPVTFVGNPLADELPLELDRQTARTKLSFTPDEPVLLLMAGSRPAELKRHLELMLNTAAKAAETLKIPRLRVLAPFSLTTDIEVIRARVETWQLEGSAAPEARARLDIRISQGDAPTCMAAATAGLVKSGTSTLEAALMRCPHSIIYKTNILTEWIFRFLIRYRGPVGLVNLIYGWEFGQPFLVREFIGHTATEQAILNETVALLGDDARRLRVSEGLERVRATILQGAADQSPSRRAAAEVLSVARGARAGDAP